MVNGQGPEVTVHAPDGYEFIVCGVESCGGGTMAVLGVPFLGTAQVAGFVCLTCGSITRLQKPALMAGIIIEGDNSVEDGDKT